MKDYLEWANKIFCNDLYATETTGIKIEDVKENYAKCCLIIEKRHQNAGANVMGGAIYTLADFTFAIAANTDMVPTVSITSQINYFAATKGERLYAEAKCIKTGRSNCFFYVDVYDDLGVSIAGVTVTGAKNQKKTTKFLNA